MEQPIWEGFDEWAHFGYIQYVAQYGHPPSRSEPVSEALRRSVELAPVSPSAAESSGSLTHDAFWQLPPEERLACERELRELSAVGIFLCCELASQVPASRRAAIPILLLLASWPSVLVDVSRIGNDGLGMTLGSAFILCQFRIVRGDSGLRDWILAGAALGAVLLTKSNMLALVPLLPLVALLEALRCRSRLPQAARGLLVAFALAGLMTGWWYVKAWRDTGTFSGEQVDAAAARFGLFGKLTAVWSIRWLRVLDSTATTHIWTGGWSFLTVRSWMYRVIESVAIAAGAGLIALAARLPRKVYRQGLGVRDACFFLAACAYLLF